MSRILLIVGGGIAAYKAAELIRLARRAGHSVTPVLTAGGAAFLQEAARVTEAPVTVRCQRIEAGGIPAAPLVTARALAPLARLLGYAHPVLRPGGACLFPKGAELEQELAACTAWRMRAERFPASDRAGSVVLRVTELSHA